MLGNVEVFFPPFCPFLSEGAGYWVPELQMGKGSGVSGILLRLWFLYASINLSTLNLFEGVGISLAAADASFER